MRGWAWRLNCEHGTIRRTRCPRWTWHARAELDVLLEAGGDKTAFPPTPRRWLGRTRAAIRARFEADNDAEAAVRDYRCLIDALSSPTTRSPGVFRRANPTEGERMAVVAVGGYGRAELAPHPTWTCCSCIRTSGPRTASR